ncbi:transcriptional regulator [Acetobacter nitrogenifigens DSM 23921 = NBRC 105050]|nr:transcriptional regulator [Acetobacter nitrogenifigens DSM 23921 = NBRC 105050]
MLFAAETILDRDGIAALTLRAAAREAEVTHTAPRHHFGDLTGLLTELAASGFVRLRDRLLTEAEKASGDSRPPIIALGRGYIAFARAHPGLLQLMLRSERLDWSSAALSQAASDAFALLTDDVSGAKRHVEDSGYSNLTLAVTRLSLVHGLATLLLDGRIEAMVKKVPGSDIDALIESVLTHLVQNDAPTP